MTETLCLTLRAPGLYSARDNSIIKDPLLAQQGEKNHDLKKRTNFVDNPLS